MNTNILPGLTDRELLRYVDRKDPVVAELAFRLEDALDRLGSIDDMETQAQTALTLD